MTCRRASPCFTRCLEGWPLSKHPIAGGESFQTESAEASFSQGMSHQHSGADKEKEARELQISSEGRQLGCFLVQLGCLLVQRTKGETQLKVTKWLVATNGWEAWRQLNLSFLSRLLNSLLHTSFEDYTSFLFATTLCLEGACGDLSRAFWRATSRISHDFCCFESGLKEKTRHFLLLHLDGDSSFGDVGNLLAIYFSMHEEQDSSLHMMAAAACKE